MRTLMLAMTLIFGTISAAGADDLFRTGDSNGPAGQPSDTSVEYGLVPNKLTPCPSYKTSTDDVRGVACVYIGNSNESAGAIAITPGAQHTIAIAKNTPFDNELKRLRAWRVRHVAELNARGCDASTSYEMGDACTRFRTHTGPQMGSEGN